MGSSKPFVTRRHRRSTGYRKRKSRQPKSILKDSSSKASSDSSSVSFNTSSSEYEPITRPTSGYSRNIYCLPYSDVEEKSLVEKYPETTPIVERKRSRKKYKKTKHPKAKRRGRGSRSSGAP